MMKMGDPRLDRRQFIAMNMPVAEIPGIPEISLHAAYPASGLRRLAGQGKNPPYWAYPWAGGLALARHILDRPQTVAGRRVLDLGAGSGLVGIAAAMAGAGHVTAAEIDRNAIAALELNAEINGVSIAIVADDLTAGPPPDVDLVLVGDLFYERQLACRVTAFLDRCLLAGVAVLIGDPGRAFLPTTRLRRLADYAVSDVGDTKNGATRPSAVFSLDPPP